MSDYIYLQGSEGVTRAATVIRNAAETMSQVGNQLDAALAALMQHQTLMIERFENVVEKFISAVQGSRVLQLAPASIEGVRSGRFHNTGGTVTEVERGRVPTVEPEPVVVKSRFEDEAAGR